MRRLRASNFAIRAGVPQLRTPSRVRHSDFLRNFLVYSSVARYIANIWSQPGGSQAVYVNSEGKLGAIVSSARFKDEIKPINQASEAIHRLRPVSFRYKAEVEPTRPVGFGLIAEEVEKIRPDLVTRSSDGQADSVRYDAVNAMLLNEFLKEHSNVSKLESTVAHQQKQIEALTAGLQKVSAQIELSKSAPQIADNP